MPETDGRTAPGAGGRRGEGRLSETGGARALMTKRNCPAHWSLLRPCLGFCSSALDIFDEAFGCACQGLDDVAALLLSGGDDCTQDGEVIGPLRDRKPPEIFWRSFIMRRSRSASLLVKRHLWVGQEAQGCFLALMQAQARLWPLRRLGAPRLPGLGGESGGWLSSGSFKESRWLRLVWLKLGALGSFRGLRVIGTPERRMSVMASCAAWRAVLRRLGCGRDLR